jgi:hypothetical protein
MSATLFDVYDEKAYGATFEDPSGYVKVKATITGFVNDTNSCVNEWLPQRAAGTLRLHQKVQHDAQLWTDLVHVSGGKLELTKCSVHRLSFLFAPDGPPLVDYSPSTVVRLQDPMTKEIIELKTLMNLQPHKTLGHWKAPAGNSKTQLKVLQDKTKIVSIRIATSSVSRYGA